MYVLQNRVIIKNYTFVSYCPFQTYCMKKDNKQSLVVRNQTVVNFTKFQLNITKKLIEKEAKEWILQAQKCIEKVDYPRAIDACMKALTMEPENAVAFRYSGIARMLIGDIADALEDFDQALRIVPDDILTYKERGFLYYELKKYGQAISDFSKIIAIDSTQVEAWYSRAYTKYDLHLDCAKACPLLVLCLYRHKENP